MVMDNNIIREMMSYYDERADTYDEIYLGRGHTTIDPDVYQKDVATVSTMVSDFGKGHLIDIACGAGFWLPYYAWNCSQITFLDQSEKMLSKCKERVETLGLTTLSNFVQGDFLDVKLELAQYDCALVGFFLSHLASEQEKAFFGRLEILKPNPQLMVIDSAWNKRRQRYRAKEGIQERVLNDGQVFKIYKRYFEEADVEGMFERYGFAVVSCYVGEALIAAVAKVC
jgi:ubiquinone/menaquinone biosynthesis C-methylase UbiE